MRPFQGRDASRVGPHFPGALPPATLSAPFQGAQRLGPEMPEMKGTCSLTLSRNPGRAISALALTGRNQRPTQGSALHFPCWAAITIRTRECAVIRGLSDHLLTAWRHGELSRVPILKTDLRRSVSGGWNRGFCPVGQRTGGRAAFSPGHGGATRSTLRRTGNLCAMPP